MKRIAESDLLSWYQKKHRMPLVLRGARQVGKSTLVRLFCESQKIDLIEVNLEKLKLKSAQSEEIQLQAVLDEIQMKLKKRLSPNSLIFLDEIQEQPKLHHYLRYFYEERPDLAVIAAGSLLEFTLNSGQFSFPVGRVEFYHLGPMTFIEFLWATGQELLAEKIQNLDFSESVGEVARQSLKNYFYVGGMPKAVQVFASDHSLLDVRLLQEQILETYIADFPKYRSATRGGSNIDRIQRVFSSSVLQLGKKVVYQRFDDGSQSKQIRDVIDLLIQARVLLSCIHTQSNSIPLAGESDPSIQKLYFLDVGLVNAMMRLDFEAIDRELEGRFNSKGVMCEQFVAQHLAFITGHAVSPQLYYWLRDKGSQKGEVDFIISKEDKVFPVKVKASNGGHLKSLFYFAKEKLNQRAIKISIAPFKKEMIRHRIEERTVELELISLPLWAIDSILKVV